ncbi:hypothetical protein HpHA219_12680 [Helicobacter pylori]
MGVVFFGDGVRHALSFFKIPVHYSASDRARKVRNKNLKSIFEKSVKNQQKEKRSNPPQKRGFKKKEGSKKENLKKKSLKKERV